MKTKLVKKDSLPCHAVALKTSKHVKTCLRTSLMEFIFHQTTMIELNDAVERFEIAWAIVGRKGFRVEEMLYNPIERIS